jgi:DNA invertase Pin-like site-specific DNA recombinase
MTIWGYARISRKTQNIERQLRNISTKYPTAIIIKEAYTGTKLQGRKELDKMLTQVKSGDLIIFDSASRMSRNTTEAIELYEDLFNKGVNLEFLKEPHINTDVYKTALQNQIEINATTGNEATDKFIDGIIKALNSYTIDLAKEQIKLAFAQAEKEVEDLHQRTKEGLVTAKLNGKQIGRKTGTKVETKKSKECKEKIQKYNRDFNGQLNDLETIQLIGISMNTFYKYKKELRESMI